MFSLYNGSYQFPNLLELVEVLLGNFLCNLGTVLWLACSHFSDGCQSCLANWQPHLAGWQPYLSGCQPHMAGCQSNLAGCEPHLAGWLGLWPSQPVKSGCQNVKLAVSTADTVDAFLQPSLVVSVVSVIMVVSVVMVVTVVLVVLVI